MEVELGALKDNHTWEQTFLPKRKRAIDCKWVFKLKFNADGTVQRCKRRLIAKGYTQEKGLDYTETFSLVIKLTNIRVLLALVAFQNWHLHELDINNAF